MSMTYGHSATETIVSIVEGTERDTGLDLNQLEEIAAYFRDVRKKYAAFEGSLKGFARAVTFAALCLAFKLTFTIQPVSPLAANHSAAIVMPLKCTVMLSATSQSTPQSLCS